MQKNKLTGVLGSALACSIAELIFNIIAYGLNPHLQAAAVVGLVLGAVIGGLIAAFGSSRPILGGVIATGVVFGGIIAFLAVSYKISAVLSAFDVLLVTGGVLVIGVINGFGYRLLGPET
ncbi:MAG: hypothetical protein JST44_21365 [Cyanobacteria bacterium SZAS LIN-5]|nr:hypothetical protein [Cyanobacteria bacterium SZAS LIN-5]RTL41896.1 MAG: hypothetical protein EKK48_13340 [Candidatus Melainabacteria bacterium]